MKLLCMFSLIFFSMPNSKINFGSTGNAPSWYVVNDGVMGGLSTGDLESTDRSIIFAGEISLENNGGFASIRSVYDNYDLSKYKEVEIKYRSSNYDFAMTLEMHRRFYMPYFKFNLPDTQNKWKILKIKLIDFEAYTLGRKLGYELDDESKKELIRMGFISNEKNAGKYQIEIDYLKFK